MTTEISLLTSSHHRREDCCERACTPRSTPGRGSCAVAQTRSAMVSCRRATRLLPELLTTAIPGEAGGWCSVPCAKTGFELHRPWPHRGCPTRLFWEGVARAPPGAPRGRAYCWDSAHSRTRAHNFPLARARGAPTPTHRRRNTAATGDRPEVQAGGTQKAGLFFLRENGAKELSCPVSGCDL